MVEEGNQFFMLRRIFKYIVLPVLAVFFLWTLKVLFWDIPSLEENNPHRTAFMIARGGEIEQAWKPLAQISSSLQRAVVAAEDGRFYQHDGLDFHELRESFKRNMAKKKFARGGSTITMQLAKNLYLSPHKNIVRKIFEALYALKLEQDLSKARILEIYLNVVEWGDGVYGAEAASRHYFKKSANSLSNREAAFLAAILPNPRSWGHWPPGPYVNRRIRILTSRMGSVPRATLPVPQPSTKPSPQQPRVPQVLPEPTAPPPEVIEEEPLPPEFFMEDGNETN